MWEQLGLRPKDLSCGAMGWADVTSGVKSRAEVRVVVGLLEIEKAPHRSDDSLRDFLVCAQGETKEWNEKRAKRSTHTTTLTKR